jgi:hypothetical protein
MATMSDISCRAEMRLLACAEDQNKDPRAPSEIKLSGGFRLGAGKSRPNCPYFDGCVAVMDSYIFCLMDKGLYLRTMIGFEFDFHSVRC